MSLKDNDVVVTGGSRGLGLGLVEALVAHGAHVTVVARDADALRSVRARLGVATISADAGANAYARAMGIERDEFLARFGAPMPPREFGEKVVSVLDDPKYADGFAFGLKGDTGITRLEGAAA
jgi:NAD(P)-dependent dehydrogenase (short-subunit alcohol dehydrogenase family)